MSGRVDKVAHQIKREVSLIIQDELRDPRLGFITITRAEITPDLRFARVFFSVYGNEEQWKQTHEGLEHASGFIRRELGHRLKLRLVPEVVFHEDHSAEYTISIEQRFEEIKNLDAQMAQEKKEKDDTKKTTRRNQKKKQ
ncbi:MAG: 30S ribosome-binding factor RbfA [Candidatus Omnitrophota bacterium]